MNVLSLFDGMSCGQLALKKSDIIVDNYFASEIEQNSIKVTQHNFPNTIQLGDIQDWKSWNLPKIDLILGGSPCQGFSICGNGNNFNDPRSKLFFTFCEILKEYNPKYFLLENVVMKKSWEYIISNELKCAPILINSKYFSVQSRKRLYWSNIKINQYADKNILIKDIAHDASQLLTKQDITNYGGELPKLLGVHNRSKKSIKYFLGNIQGKDEKLNCLTKSAKTNISSRGGVTVLVGKKNNSDELYYRLTTREECEIAQTVPVGYTNCVSNVTAREMLGNGWTVDVISHILSGIKTK